MKKSLLIIVAGLVCFSTTNVVNAEEMNNTVTNHNGIVFTQEKYDALVNIYSKNFVDYMTEETYSYIKDADLSEVEIVETTDAMLNSNGARAQEYTTASKSLRIINVNNYITVSLTWLKVPTIKKWDVMAARKNSSVNVTSTYSFRQYYETNDTVVTSLDRYAQDFDNGAGATFKVGNGSAHEMEYSFKASGTGRIYASYQHANNSSATLANAMNYTLSGSGYGGVILFDSSIEGKFDGMGGVYLTI